MFTLDKQLNDETGQIIDNQIIKQTDKTRQIIDKQTDKTRQIIDKQTDEFIEKVKLLISHIDKYAFPLYTGEDVIVSYCNSTIPSIELFQRAIYLSLCEDNDRYFMFDTTTHLAVRITREQLEYVISEIFTWYINYGNNLYNHFIVTYRHKYVNYAVSKVHEMKLFIIYAYKVTINVCIDHSCSAYECSCNPFKLISYNPDIVELHNNKVWSVSKGWSPPLCIYNSSSYIDKLVEDAHVGKLHNILLDILGNKIMIEYVMFTLRDLFDDMCTYRSIILVNDTFIYRLMRHILSYVQYIILTIDDLSTINNKRKLYSKYKYNIVDSVVVLHDDIWNTWIKTNKPRKSFLYHIITSLRKHNRYSPLRNFNSRGSSVNILSVSDNVLKQMHTLCGLGIKYKMYLTIPCSNNYKYSDVDEKIYVNEFARMIRDTPTDINLHYHVPKPIINYNNSLT